jgi:hypothetical protein
MANKHDIFIFEAAGEFRVRPAVAVVEMPPLRPLKIRNMTRHTVVVVFPPGVLAAGSDLVQHIIPAAQPGPDDVLTVNLFGFPTGIPVRFQYSVSIYVNGELVPAKGESAPSVIVDP